MLSCLLTALSGQAGDLAVEGVESSEDDEVPDAASVSGPASETSSLSSGGRHSRIEEVGAHKLKEKEQAPL